MARLIATRSNEMGGPRPLTDAEVREFWVCPSGQPHVWTFRRSSDGEGLYRCHCGVTVEKRDLKRVTDHD